MKNLLFLKTYNLLFLHCYDNKDYPSKSMSTCLQLPQQLPQKLVKSIRPVQKSFHEMWVPIYFIPLDNGTILFKGTLSLFQVFKPNITEKYQRHIQNLVKHLTWDFLGK